MKKSIIGLLAAIFTFGLVLNVNAEAITTDSSKKGTVDTNSALVTNQAAINITNAPTTDVLVAYKILDTFYNASTNVFTYEFTSDFKAFLATTKDYKNLTVEQYYALTSGDTTSGSTRTQSTLDKLVSLYAAYVKTHSVTTSATLTYANDPYGTGTTTTAAVNVSAFTYGIEAFIYSDKDNSVKLSGVKFEVYSDSSLNTKVGEFTTDGNGRGSLAGVKAGTYYLKQVSTAAGYTLPKDAVPVKVKIPGATAGTVTGYYRADIAAYEAGSLPFTGGSGTSLFSLIGLLVIGASAVAIIVYRNKKEEVAE